MLKSSVVDASTNLVGCLGSDSTSLHEFTVPVIRHCTVGTKHTHNFSRGALATSGRGRQQHKSI